MYCKLLVELCPKIKNVITNILLNGQLVVDYVVNHNNNRTLSHVFLTLTKYNIINIILCNRYYANMNNFFLRFYVTPTSYMK